MRVANINQRLAALGYEVEDFGNVPVELPDGVAWYMVQDGHAVVQMNIEPKYAPLIHPDASLLLRPKTGLKDMIVEMDPGTKAAGGAKSGARKAAERASTPTACRRAPSGRAST